MRTRIISSVTVPDSLSAYIDWQTVWSCGELAENAWLNYSALGVYWKIGRASILRAAYRITRSLPALFLPLIGGHSFFCPIMEAFTATLLELSVSNRLSNLSLPARSFTDPTLVWKHALNDGTALLLKACSLENFI